MANVDLSRIIKDVSAQNFAAEYQPVLDQSGQPAPATVDCKIPPFVNPPIDLPELPPPVIVKDCQLPFIPVPVVPQPFVDVVFPGLDCPDGLVITGEFNIKNSGVIVSTAQLTSTPGEACSYKLTTDIDFDVIIPCPDGHKVNSGVTLRIIEDNAGNSTSYGTATSLFSAVATSTCVTDLTGAIEIHIPKVPVNMTCIDNGYVLDTSQFYVQVDDPNSCEVTKHEFKAGQGKATEKPPVFVLAGKDGKIFTSIDLGAHWITQTVGSATYRGAVTGKEHVMVVGAGIWAASSDPYGAPLATPFVSTWISSSFDGTLNAVAFGCSKFMAVANDKKIYELQEEGLVPASTWTDKYTSATELKGIAFGCSKKFVAVGAGIILVSPDSGTTWTSPTVDTQYTWTAVTQGGGKFVVVSSEGKIAVSDDCGKTFKAAYNSFSGTVFTAVTHDGEYFTAVGTATDIGTTGGAYRSKNGHTWTLLSRDLIGNCIVGNGAKLLMVGGDSTHTYPTTLPPVASTSSTAFAAAFKSGNPAGEAGCTFGFYPPLKLQMPFVPCPDGHTVSAGTFVVRQEKPDSNDLTDPLTYGAADTPRFQMSVESTACGSQLSGTLVLPYISGSTPNVCSVPRWG